MKRFTTYQDELDEKTAKLTTQQRYRRSMEKQMAKNKGMSVPEWQKHQRDKEKRLIAIRDKYRKEQFSQSMDQAYDWGTDKAVNHAVAITPNQKSDRKCKPLTKHFIEIMGKRKKLVKEDVPVVSTANVVGTGSDVAHWKYGKKKKNKSKILRRADVKYTNR